MEEEKVVNICYITDERYVGLTMVSIQSIITNKRNDSIYRVYVIGDALSEQC